MWAAAVGAMAAAAFAKVDPDLAFDALPQPYALIVELLEEAILQQVEEHIERGSSKRIGAEEGVAKGSDPREHGLRQAGCNGRLGIDGRITCAHVEPRNARRLVVGTSLGEILLIDVVLQQVVKQKQVGSSEGSEAVKCVVFTSDAVHHVAAKLRPRIVVALSASPQLAVYEVHDQQFGADLRRCCSIQVHDADGRDAADHEEGGPVVEQLQAVGTYRGTWVVVLLSNRAVHCFLCPTIVSEAQHADGARDYVLKNPIMEENEDSMEDVRGGGGSEMEECLHIGTPTYTLIVPSLAPLRGLPEPDLSSLRLSLLTTRPTGAARVSSQVPSFAFLHSSDSTHLLAYALPAPRPAQGAAGRSTEEILKDSKPAPSRIEEPEAPQSLGTRRHWAMPSKISASAASQKGGVFAVGTVRGGIALASVAAGPSLHTSLPGHYGMVTALAFHADNLLISAGADGWVQHYDVRSNTVLARHFSTPPPEGLAAPPPAVCVASSQSLPLAYTLDAAGNLRLHDLVRGSKVARLYCMPADMLDSTFPSVSDEESRVPRDMLATANGLCVLCEAQPTVQVPPATASSDGKEPVHGDGGGADEEVVPEGQVTSCVALFNQEQLLGDVYPALANCGKDSQKELFSILTAEALQQGQLVDVSFAAEEPTQLPEAAKTKQSGTSRKSLATSSRRMSFAAEPRKSVAAAPRKSIAAGATAATGKSISAAPGSADANDATNLGALTAENLRRVLGVARDGSLASLATLPGAGAPSVPAGGAGGGLALAAARQHQAHAVPESWSAAAKRQLRVEAGGGGSRQVRCLRRIDQLRKAIDD